VGELKDGRLGGLNWLRGDPDLRIVLRVLNALILIGLAGLIIPIYQSAYGKPVSWSPAVTFGGLIVFYIVVCYLMNNSIEQLLIWSKSKYKGLSFIGVFLKRRTIRTYIAAALIGLTTTLYILCLEAAEAVQDWVVVALLGGLLIAIVLYQKVLEYRVRKGLFGSTGFEARAILELLMDKPEDLDLHDDGKVRRLLSGDDFDAIRQIVREALPAAKDT
jgi:hypothetical protein